MSIDIAWLSDYGHLMAGIFFVEEQLYKNMEAKIW